MAAGLEPVGALVYQWAKIMGARRIIAIDSVPHRLNLVASKYGPETINFSQVEDVVGAIKQIVANGRP